MTGNQPEKVPTFYVNDGAKVELRSPSVNTLKSSEDTTIIMSRNELTSL